MSASSRVVRATIAQVCLNDEELKALRRLNKIKIAQNNATAGKPC